MVKKFLIILLCVMLLPIPVMADLPTMTYDIRTDINNLKNEIETQYATKEELNNLNTQIQAIYATKAELQALQIPPPSGGTASIYVDVASFGAVGDGVADDTQALLDAKAYVLAAGGVFYIPEQMNCKVVGNIDLFGIKYIKIDGKVTGSLATNEFIIGLSSLSASPANYFINEVDGMKLKIQGLKNADVQVNKAEHVLLWADGDVPEISGLSYCRFTLGFIEKLEVNSQGAAIGWINENKFYGVHFLELVIDGNYPHNNNIFYNPTIESCTVNIDNGTDNYFYDCRFEGENTITFGPGTSGNIMYRSWSGYYPIYLSDRFDTEVINNGKDNYVIHNRDLFTDKKVIFEANSRSKNYNLDYIRRNQNGITIKTPWSDFYESDFIPVDKPMGFLLKSNSTNLRLCLYVYDVNKNPITVEPTNFTDILNSYWHSSGYFVQGYENGIGGIPVVPHNTVKYVKLKLIAGSATGDVDYIRITHLQDNREIIKVNQLGFTTMNASAMPTEGYFEKGDYVQNNNPTLAGTSPNKYIINGWIRLTTGIGHTLGVDWVQDRRQTGL